MTLESVTARLAPLEAAAFRAHWGMATDATPAARDAARDAQLAQDTALGDPSLHAFATAAAEAARDPLTRRSATRLRLTTGARQRPPELIARIVELETSLTARYASHRAEVRGVRLSDNEIDEILLESNDVDLRREAWEASKTVGAAVADDLRRLVRLRNEAAQRLGHRDHYALALAMDEIDEGWLGGFLDELDASLGPAWAEVKAATDDERRDAFGIAAGAPLMPWFEGDRFGQEAPPDVIDPLRDAVRGIDIVAVARRYFAALGDDVDAILARSDLYPRDGKDQHAFQLTMDRTQDIRILCNIGPTVRWLETTLHELGHAIYDQAIDPSLPWLVRTPAHTFTTEAIAMTHGRLARDATFLERFALVSAEVAGNPVNRRSAALHLLVFAPWVQVMSRFERALYADPDQDLGTLWWDLVERYQRIARPPGDRTHDWAAKIHFTVAPVYYHNYLLGEACASQLGGLLERETGSASPAANPASAGSILRERFLVHGGRYRWDELVERATGAPLGTSRLVADAMDYRNS